MYVRNQMTTDVVTVFKDASIDLAFQLMMEKGCKQIPVVEDGKLVGCVTEQLLSEVSPSKATTLSMYELNYLLSKTKVKDIMIKDMPIGNPGMLIEEAAQLMKSSGVDSLPITEGDKLVGIITRTDILQSFLELTGVSDIGTRISVKAKDEAGILANITSIIKDFNINIVHIANYNHIGTDDTSEVVIRLGTTDIEPVTAALRDAGYEILNIKKNNIGS
jgi:acetoin utilization protein AcuB